MKRPGRVSVTLSYQRGKENAPRVDAVGQGELDKAIRRAARRYGIPVRKDSTLAETLAAVDEGSEIPPLLYEQVAALLGDLERK